MLAPVWGTASSVDRAGLARRLLAATATAGVLGLSVSATALAAPAWLAPHKLSEGPSAASARVAVDPAGDAVAVWQHQVAGIWVIEASSRAAGGAWSSPVTLSKATEEAVSPQVAISRAGATVAVWERVSGGVYALEAAAGSAQSATWQPPREVPSASSMVPLLARVATDSGGDALATWERLEGSNGVVEASFHPDGSGSWRAARTLSKTGEYMHPPQVAMDAEGLAVAVWEDKSGERVVIDGSRKPAGGETWQPGVRVSPLPEFHNANEPQLAMDARGDAVAVWERFHEVEEIEAASMPAGSEAWRAPVTISTLVGEDEPGNQQVAIDGQGRAVVVWLRETANEIEATAQNGDGSWQGPAVISPPGVTPSEPVVAVDASGDGVAAWVQEAGGKALLASASRAAVGGWRTAVAVPGEAKVEAPVIDIDGQGDALAAWKHYTGSYAIEASVYDAAGPLLNALSIPTSGSVGQPLSFSVSPLDAWSALGATSWSFGDGASASGTSVAHTYAAAGSYSVTLTSVDALANTTNASATVVIAPAPTSIAPSVGIVPSVANVAQSHRRWRAGSRLASFARRRRVPLGTTFSFTLNERANVSFAFTQRLAGHRVRGKCVAATNENRRKPACKRTVTEGTLSFAGHTGTNRVSFQGNISRSRKLGPGNYTLLITASSSAGQRSQTRSLSFTIVK
jgi:hypothetical protein